MKSPLVRILAILIAFATVSVGFAQSPDEAAHKAPHTSRSSTRASCRAKNCSNSRSR